MKKILLFIIVLISAYSYSQTINEIKSPGGSITSTALDSVAGDNTYLYFGLRNPILESWSMQFTVVTTIATDSTVAILEGSNWLGNWTQIDTLDLPNAQATFTTPKVITGTTLPYAVYRWRIPDDSLTNGVVRLLIHCY